MQCVCPMGGDRTCPNDCPLAVWATLSPKDRKAQRKAIAERLYKQKFTMEQIATQLGVAQKTISKDLDGVYTEGINSERTSKRGRKNEGRPKGRKGPQPERNKSSPAIYDLLASLVLDEGKTYGEAADAGGVSEQVVKTSVAREQGRREAAAESEIDPATLSKTAQEKFNAAIRQHQRKLDLEFEHRVREETRKNLDQLWLPNYVKEWRGLRDRLDTRRGYLKRPVFKKILACLHPDSRNSASDKMLADAFDTFKRLEFILCNEQEAPTAPIDMPRTVDELLRRKAEVSAARKAKRANAHSVART